MKKLASGLIVSVLFAAVWVVLSVAGPYEPASAASGADLNRLHTLATGDGIIDVEVEAGTGKFLIYEMYVSLDTEDSVNTGPLVVGIVRDGGRNDVLFSENLDAAATDLTETFSIPRYVGAGDTVLVSCPNTGVDWEVGFVTSRY